MLRREAWTGIFVVPFGNLLGIVLAVAALSPVLALAGYCVVHPLARGILVAAGSAAMVVTDLLWRRGHRDLNPVVRWLSPFRGGNVACIPSWLLGLLPLVAEAYLLFVDQPQRH